MGDRGSATEVQQLWDDYASVRFGPGTSKTHLGSPEPWFAMEALRVFILCTALCSRVARWQAQGGDGPLDVPRCGLDDWIEDMESSKCVLRYLNLLPAAVT